MAWIVNDSPKRRGWFYDRLFPYFKQRRIGWLIVILAVGFWCILFLSILSFFLFMAPYLGKGFRYVGFPPNTPPYRYYRVFLSNSNDQDAVQRIKLKVFDTKPLELIVPDYLMVKPEETSKDVIFKEALPGGSRVYDIIPDDEIIDIALYSVGSAAGFDFDDWHVSSWDVRLRRENIEFALVIQFQNLERVNWRSAEYIRGSSLYEWKDKNHEPPPLRYLSEALTKYKAGEISLDDVKRVVDGLPLR